MCLFVEVYRVVSLCKRLRFLIFVRTFNEYNLEYVQIYSFCFYTFTDCPSLPYVAQKPDYRLFQNISLGTEASVISCFLQDTQGLIWIGSDKGLFSYDGYSTQPHFIFGERSNTRIYCGEVVDSTYLYLGADNGLLIYNYRTDTYEEPGIDFPTDIRTLVMYDGLLWLGT